MDKRIAGIGVLVLVAQLIAAPAVAGQEILAGRGFGVDYDSVELELTHVGGRVHMLRGAGGNLGVFVSDDGVFLVDGQFAPLTQRIQAEIRSLSPEPVRFLINTHFHGDHTGGNYGFAPAGALIVAHENVRSTLAVPHYIEMVDTRWQAFGEAVLPVITFADSMTFHLGGERIDVIHAPPSHTNGDSLVFFRDSNVIHMGDVYRSRGQPIFDRNNGGTYEGLIRASEFVLDLIDDDTTILPGHGVLSTRTDLVEVRDIMAAVRDRIQQGIDAGLSVEEVVASNPSEGFEWRDGRLTVEETVRWIYTELTANGR
jgi:glyoxylase-like metal-dependent hydrolase (beta-lactamase superfamily II)